jgi:putative FmdB family regulatory protein
MLYWGRVYNKRRLTKMPLYEYHCNKCGEAYEKMVRISEADLAHACPNCESEDTIKMISTIASFAGLESESSPSTSRNCESGGRYT